MDLYHDRVVLKKTPRMLREWRKCAEPQHCFVVE